MITLLKHEVLRTYDKLALIAGVAVLLSLTGALLAATGWPLLAEVGLMVGVVAVIGLVPVCQFMLTAAYWRSGYGRTGYLTQTLPVKGAKIYWAKTLWAWLVSLAGAALSIGILLAVAPLVAAGNGGQGASVLTSVREAWVTLNDVAGPAGVTAGIIALVLMIIIWPAQYFFAVSVGSQAPLNRLGFAGPVLVWLGLYLTTQVLVFASFSAVPLAVGMDGDRLGLVRFNLFAEMAEGTSSTADVMPLGFLPALLVITAVCIGWSVRSWNRRVSLV